MSKELLNESTIRKFMKLANIEPLANTFLRETTAGLADKGAVSGKAAMGSSTHPDHRNKKAQDAGLASQGPGLVKEEEDEEDEEVVEEGTYFEEEEDLEALGDDTGDELPAEEPAPEFPGDEGPEDTGLGEGDIEGLVAAIADAIESHTGVAVDVAGDEGAEEAEAEFAPPEGEEGGEELPALEDEEVLDEDSVDGMSLGARDGAVSERDIYNETFRRVKARLGKMQKHEQLLESLTEKIYKRLSRKNK
jgi:hypothetical protein|tara:strand:+ start:283 stop:1029 length:747 start_codon:yes stop_codon:yes gene_type:complete